MRDLQIKVNSYQRVFIQLKINLNKFLKKVKKPRRDKKQYDETKQDRALAVRLYSSLLLNGIYT